MRIVCVCESRRRREVDDSSTYSNLALLYGCRNLSAGCRAREREGGGGANEWARKGGDRRHSLPHRCTKTKPVGSKVARQYRCEPIECLG